jgi:hypothetical protein
MIRNTLDSNSHRIYTAAQHYGRKYPSLKTAFTKMLMETTDLKDLASCQEIREMLEVIEDLYNW